MSSSSASDGGKVHDETELQSVADEWDSYQGIPALDAASQDVFGEEFVGQFSSTTPSYMAELAARLELGPGKHVLDAGSGTGGLAVALAERAGCQVTGLDISPAATRVAQRRAQASSADCQFVTGDMGDPPFPAGTFDAIVSLGSAYWSQPKVTLEKWDRLQRGPGLVAFLITRIMAPQTERDRQLTLQDGLFEPHLAWEAALEARDYRLETRELVSVARRYYTSLLASLERRREQLRQEMGVTEADTYIGQMRELWRHAENGSLSRIEIIGRRTT